MSVGGVVVVRRVVAVALLLAAVAGGWLVTRGDAGAGGPPDLLWGTRGVRPGDFARPRAATLDGDGRLWIVDFTARVQAFDLDGRFLGFGFATPDYRNGRPSGLGTDNRGRLLVADSHYQTVRAYAPDGTQLAAFGAGVSPASVGGGLVPAYISDVAQDADGFYYVSEFGATDRITKLDADGTFVAAWGRPGQADGELNRPRALALGPDGLLYVADACNHRVQAFTRDGRFVRAFGAPGAGPGQFRYPYDVCFGPGGELYVADRGNCRVQKWTADGTFLAAWGGPGHGPGQLADPWAVVVDKLGRVHVVDTENHRVQRVRF